MSRNFNNPAEKQGLVVTNATLDRQEIARRRCKDKRRTNRLLVPGCNSTVTDEVLTIQPHDLTFRTAQTKAQARNYQDTEIHVIGSTNGLDVNDKGNRTSAMRRKRKRSQLQFAGVAVTKAVFRQDASANEHEMNLPTQIGGVCTIQNTGPNRISVGDLVVWDLPAIGVEAEGCNLSGCKEKQFFITKPYSTIGGDGAKQHCYDQAQFMTDMQAAGGEDLPDFVKNLRSMKDDDDWSNLSNLVDQFQTYVDDQRGRVIGRALSSAKPGHVFDIMLGHYAA